MRFSERLTKRLVAAALLLLGGLLFAQVLNGMPRIQVLCGRGSVSLCAAIERGDIERVDALLQAGAPANAVEDGDWSPLMLAVACDKPEICTLLIRHGASLQADPDMLPLCAAARDGRSRVVRALLDAGAKPNVCNRRGLTPLMDAAAFGY